MNLTELLVTADALLEQGQVPTLAHGGCPEVLCHWSEFDDTESEVQHRRGYGAFVAEKYYEHERRLASTAAWRQGYDPH